jgi:hypothetical protein
VRVLLPSLTDNETHYWPSCLVQHLACVWSYTLLKDGRVNCEWCIRNYLAGNKCTFLLRQRPCLCPKNQKHCQYRWCLGQDSNWMPLEYKFTAAHITGRLQDGYVQSICGNPKKSADYSEALSWLKQYLKFEVLPYGKGGRDSVVALATRHGLDVSGIEFLWGRKFCTRPDWPRGLPSFLYNVSRVSLRGVRRLERAVEHSPQSNA